MYCYSSDTCVSRPSPPHLGPRSAARGFTLLEVMVVVAILGILAAIAAPSFTPLIERWRTRQAAEGLQSTLYFARSEAIKRGGGVSIKAKTGKDWGSGWQVVFSESGADTVLQNTDAPTGVKVSIDLTDDTGTLAIDRWGRLDGVAAELAFSLTPTGAKTGNTNYEGVCIGLGGHIKRDKKCATAP